MQYFYTRFSVRQHMQYFSFRLVVCTCVFIFSLIPFGGRCMCVVVCVLLFLASRNVTDWWLSYWVSATSNNVSVVHDSNTTYTFSRKTLLLASLQDNRYQYVPLPDLERCFIHKALLALLLNRSYSLVVSAEGVPTKRVWDWSRDQRQLKPLQCRPQKRCPLLSRWFRHLICREKISHKLIVILLNLP